jgi:AcrR family transcriptional regulator
MPSREEKKAATRRKLLDAAAVLVAKNGAVATSLDAIAEKAGLTKGAVYSNFKNKEQLMYELGERAGPEIGTTPRDGESVADYFERLGRDVVRANRTVSRQAWRLGSELHWLAVRDPRFRKLYAKAVEPSRTLFAREIERAAAASGERLPLSPQETFTVLNALATGLSDARVIDPDSVPDELFGKVFRLLAG